MLQRISDYTYSSVASYLYQGFVGGFVWGFAEAGPRALGNRSILADARCVQIKDRINGYIKNRMAFQPLAPVCLEEDFDRFFQRPPCDISLEYMLFAVKCKEEAVTKLPGILHADHTARVQVVNQQRNPNLHALLTEFKKYSGVGVLINTSFNGKGEPIVNTVEQAYNAYRKLDLDFLVMDKFLISNKL